MTSEAKRDESKDEDLITEEPTEEPTPTTEEVNDEVTEIKKSSEKLNELIEQFQGLFKETKSIISNLKSIKKEVVKLEKKKNRKRDPNRVKRKVTGFSMPVPISNELSEFLELSPGEDIPRQTVLKKITEYIKKYDLQNPDDRRKIKLDLEGGEKLAQLLKIEKDSGIILDFFNLQTYLKPHFLKNVNTTPHTSEGASATTSRTRTRTRIVT
jgi:chromatin remodeling complex protein RSC6